ncbi:MAG: SpoIID/LytB domain-containing protein, partial [Candidatus Omnitrophica bacterium]|nr:SpoIID/LytB domain-containing protein [Candidatus Omnitrophota bacterium]
MKKLRIIFLIFLCLPLMAFSSRSTTDETRVRIALLKDETDFYISAQGQYEIIDPTRGAVLEEGRRLKEQQVVVNRRFVQFGRTDYKTPHVRIIAHKYITIAKGDDAKQYRGQIDIYVTERGLLLVVNTLGLEEYVRGVLFHEVSHRWPMEALKAQAVATRSYVLYQAHENQEQKYDVTSDIYSQVYGGKSAERYRTNIATKRTEGEVMIYNGKILPAYFHANSGGHTEDVKEMWNHPDLPPLSGVEDPYAEEAPAYYWRRNFRSGDIQRLLKDNGYRIGLIKDITVIDRTRSGRVRTLRIEDRDGKVITISGKAFRHIVG